MQKEDWIDKHLTMYFKNLANNLYCLAKKLIKWIYCYRGAGFLEPCCRFLTNLGHNVTIFDKYKSDFKMIIKIVKGYMWLWCKLGGTKNEFTIFALRE